MGVKDFFASRRVARSERQVARAAKRLGNKHGQTAERKRCIELLETAATDDAIAGLLHRFTFRTDVQIIDEDEKEAVFDALLRIGPQAIPAIQHFIHEETAIYWGLRALTEIAGEDAAVDILIEEIDAITEGYDRDMLRKHELVSNLREFPNERVFKKLLELLEEENEEIRILAIDGLSAFDRPDVVDHFVPLLSTEEESHRVRQMVLDLFIARGWSIKKYRKEVAAQLPEHFWVDDTGRIQRK